MSTDSSSRRPTRRCVRDSNRRKMALNVDLNSPPAEALQGTAALPINQSQRSQPESVASDGLVSSPIDVEAIDDDLQMLSSPRGFPQARNQSRRNRPVMVVLDEDPGICSGRSGVPVHDPVTASCLNRHNKKKRIPPNGTIINCENYSISQDDYNAKRKKLNMPGPEKVVPKEPTFSCPICLGTLVDACSTVCGHIFCEGCIKASIQAQKKCPTCRKTLKMNNFHRVFLPTTTTATN